MPYTSQLHGKFKCMFSTLNNMMCTLPFQAHLSTIYWVEALHMAIHLLNILPYITLHNDTLYRKIFHTKPTYSHLYVFGCLCYPHLPKTNKLEHHYVLCIFLVYPSNHKVFCYLNLHTKQIIIVTFNETNFPFGSMTPDASLSYDFLDIPES